MNNTIVFFRHAETKKDKSIPVSEWVLTEEGEKKVQEVVDSSIFDDVDVIIASTETKAFQSVEPLAKKLGKDVIQIKDFSEINRDSGEIMSKEDYHEMKVKIFEDLDYTNFGWETCRHALERFKKAVEEINQKCEGKKIIIASHGTVMSLYFADLQGKLDELMERWKGLGFCDYGIVENGKVVKDIVPKDL